MIFPNVYEDELEKVARNYVSLWHSTQKGLYYGHYERLYYYLQNFLSVMNQNLFDTA